jgi:hypothetical protein
MVEATGGRLQLAISWLNSDGGDGMVTAGQRHRIYRLPVVVSSLEWRLQRRLTSCIHERDERTLVCQYFFLEPSHATSRRNIPLREPLHSISFQTKCDESWNGTTSF